jgi:hypothetical protein
MIPTAEQLLEVFASYNQQIWPVQIAAYVLGIAGLVLALRRTSYSNRIIPAILAFFWIWVAVLFWLPSTSQGFSPGYILFAVFLVQGLLFLLQAFRPGLAFGYRPDFISWTGIFIGLAAMFGYPALGYLLGNVYPYTPPFGLTPCPLVAYTFGLLLLTERRVPIRLLIIPFVYAVSGFLWVSIGIVEDVLMILSGLLGGWLIWNRNARQASILPAESSPVQSDPGWSLDIPEQK